MRTRDSSHACRMTNKANVDVLSLSLSSYECKFEGSHVLMLFIKNKNETLPVAANDDVDFCKQSYTKGNSPKDVHFSKVRSK
jgi:hypothetical protein